MVKIYFKDGTSQEFEEIDQDECEEQDKFYTLVNNDNVRVYEINIDAIKYIEW